MPVKTTHKLEGKVGVREETTAQGPRRILVVDTQDGDIYEVWFDVPQAAVVAKALSPIALAGTQNGKVA